MSRNTRTGTRAGGRESGTSTLEVIALATGCLFVVLVLVQGGLALYGISATQTAARHAARALSLGESPVAAADGALPGWLDATVSTFGPGNGVEVTVDLPELVPGVDLTVTRAAVMP